MATRNTNTSPSRPYSMQMAQLQVADFQSSVRHMSQLDEKPQTKPNRTQGPLQLTRIIDSLDNTLPLPNDLRSFLVYLTALLIVIVGMMVHVLLSAQILQLQVELSRLQNRHAIIERETGEVLWQIGRATNLQNVEDRAKAAGYAPITEREYVGVDGPNALEAEQGAARIAARDVQQDDETAQPVQIEERGVAASATADGIDPTDTLATAITPDDILLQEQPATLLGRLQLWQEVLLPASKNASGSPAEPSTDGIVTPVIRPADESETAEPQTWQPAWTEQIISAITSWFDRTSGQ